MSSPEYVPFSPLENVYESQSQTRFEERAWSFLLLINIGKLAVRTEFREYCQKLLKKEFPHLRCSPARAVIEGRMPGVPKFLDQVLPSWKHDLDAFLNFCDLMETISWEYSERLKLKIPKGVLEEVREAEKVLGHGKDRSILSHVLENVHAPEVREAEKADGSGVPLRSQEKRSQQKRRL